MSTFPSRRFLVLTVAASLLVAAIPASAFAHDPEVAFQVQGIDPPPCPEEAGADDGQGCLIDGEVEFTASLTNLDDDYIKHVLLAAPSRAEGAGTARLVSADVNGNAGVVRCSVPSATEDEFSCYIYKMYEGDVLNLRVAFTPDDTGAYEQQVTWGGLTLYKADHAIREDADFVAGCTDTCTDTVSFLRGQDADGSSFTVEDGGQTTTVTLPATAEVEALFISIEHLTGTDGFCGEPAESLGTCFGLTSKIDVVTADGTPFVFAGCDLGVYPPEGCLQIDLTWDVDLVPNAYELAPGLVSAYHDGSIVAKCLPSVEAGTPACSTDASLIDGGDRMTIRIWSEDNGNWGAG